MNDGRAVGIEKHHLKLGANPGCAFVQHRKGIISEPLVKATELSGPNAAGSVV
jgi:hypothetical protein